MKKTTKYLFTACITGVLLSGSFARGLELTVTNHHDVALNRAIISGGVPFAKGTLKDVAELGVTLGGKALPAQFAKTVPWDDGSVRWAVLNTQAPLPAHGSITLNVAPGASPAPSSPLAVQQNDNGVAVSTGPLVLLCRNDAPGLIQSIRVDGEELLTGEGRGPVLTLTDGKQVTASAPTEVTVEESGPMRAVIRVKGGFPGIHKDLVRYTARIHLYAGRKIAKVHFWLENHGADGHGKVKPEWFVFEAMGLEFGLGLGDTVTARCEDVEGTGPFKVLQRCQGDGKRPDYTYEDLDYVITSGDKTLKTGARTDGIIALKGANGSLTTGIRYFWQTYEKAIALDGNHLTLHLWPKEGEWPRPVKGRGGRLRRLKSVVQGPDYQYYALQGSAHVGHEFILDFSGATAAETAADLNGPLFPLADSAYYAASRAAPEFFAGQTIETGHKMCNNRLQSCFRMSRRAVDPNDDTSVYAARKSFASFALGYRGDFTFWHGWMDFGDICIPGVGSVSLEHDWPLLVMFEYLRHGNPAALNLSRQMARHRIDIDQYWSDRDPPTMNGVQAGIVWPGYHADGRDGGYARDATHAAGPVLWYMLTGEPKAKEAALRSGEGLVRAWDAMARGRLKSNVAANGWTINSFCALYDLTGQKRWLDEAIKLFNENLVPIWKEKGPHLHDPGIDQVEGQAYRKRDEAYSHAIGSLCNLHRLSGDANVLKLLVEGCENPLSSDSYFDAPMFTAGLYAYVGAVTGNEAYLKKAAGTFAFGYPASKNQPVFVPDNKLWSDRYTMHTRAGLLLNYAFWMKNNK